MLKKIIFQSLAISFIFTFGAQSAESGGMPQLNPEFWISQIFWLVLILGSISFDKTIYKIPKVSTSQKICEIQNSGSN